MTTTDRNNTLDVLVERTLTTHRAQEAQRLQRLKEAREEEERHVQRQLLAHLQGILTPDFYEKVDWQFDCRHSNSTYIVSAFFSYLSYDWHVSGSPNNWTIYYTKPRQALPYGTKATNLLNDQLQAKLLLVLGQRLEEVQKEKAEQEQRERTYEQQRVARIEQEEQIAAQQQRARAEAEAIHQRLEQHVTEAVALAEQELWHWPAGVTIEIYKIKYCDGSGRNEDGDQAFDYVEGWTAVSALDDKNRIRLEPVMPYAWSNHASAAQVVQLIPEIHRPIWTVYTVSSTEELPDALVRRVDVVVNGIVKRTDYAIDSESRFVEITQSELNYEEEWYAQTVGKKPLKWIRDLVEQSAAQ